MTPAQLAEIHAGLSLRERVSGSLRPLIVGVDPGAVWTGICARWGAQALAWRVVRRAGRINSRTLNDTGYLEQIEADVLDVTREAAATLAERDTLLPTGDADYDARELAAHRDALASIAEVALEAMHAPTPKLGMTNAGYPMAACITFGWVLRAFHDRAVLIAPAAHGSAPLAAYPACLVTAKERRHGLNRVGGGDMRHVRSAYDIAGAVTATRRINAAAAKGD